MNWRRACWPGGRGGSAEAAPGPRAVHGLRIGIVTGHSGPYPGTGVVDPGSTCPDGLTELQVNQSVADLVADGLEGAGFQVDRMEEWDERPDRVPRRGADLDPRRLVRVDQ